MDKGTFKQWLVKLGIPAFNLYKENIKQEPTPQEQLDKDGADFDKVVAEIKGTRVTCIINDGINTPPAQEPWPEEPFGHMAGGVQPPQRPWVDLTEKQIEVIEEMALTKQWAIRMALTAVKEKNA